MHRYVRNRLDSVRDRAEGGTPAFWLISSDGGPNLGSHEHACRSLHMEVRLERLDPPSEHAIAAGKRIRLAIVSMTKRPVDILGWLEHHRRLGVERFYLRIEDTPELSKTLEGYAWSSIVDRTFATNTQRDYIKQTARQNAHVAESIPKAESARITHILHIDDDELLYCAGGMDALKAELASHSDPHTCDFHLANLEALATSPSEPAHAIFRRGGTRAFRHDRMNYCAYMNGKSFGRVAAPRLRSHGPHGFYCDGANDRHAVPPWRGCILHFESATFSLWQSKFGDLAATHAGEADADEKLPRYYREGVRAMAALRAARAKGDAMAVEVARQGASALWKRWKMWPPAGGHAERAAFDAALAQVEATRAPQVIQGQGVTLLPLEPIVIDDASLHGDASSRSTAKPDAATAQREAGARPPAVHPPARLYTPIRTPSRTPHVSSCCCFTSCSASGTSQGWRHRRHDTSGQDGYPEGFRSAREQT